MTLAEGQRVEVGEAGGDRKRYQGRRGRVVRLQARALGEQFPPFVHVHLDGMKVSRVFWPHELYLEVGKE